MEDLHGTVFPECFIVSISYFVNFPNPILHANIHIFPIVMMFVTHLCILENTVFLWLFLYCFLLLLNTLKTTHQTFQIILCFEG